ncbi:MAG: PKD domain-containing protein, partial [Bacteroidota bacterium]
SFEFPTGYNSSLPLTIDPTLIFSTYTGSFSDNWGFTATYDSAGNAYGGGIQFGASAGSGYPTTTGAYDRTFNGGTSDVTIIKYNPTGTQALYSTFLGGRDDDQPHSLIADDDGQLVIMGRTNSANFPTQNGADNTFNGGFDIFVTKLSADGMFLLGSTFLGGSLDDGVNGSTVFSTYTNTKYNYGDDARGEVVIDAQNNVYVTAPTNSSNFPVRNGFQMVKSSGQDGVVVKLDPNLNNIIWASFFGGTGEDASHTLKFDPSGNVIIAGGTSSRNLPVTPGAYQATYGGGTDGFITQIAPDGRTILACTYLGTGSYDQVYLMDLDEEGDIYVAGQTQGNWPIISPPAGGVYRNNGAKQFIHKLENDLTASVYATTVGSANASFPNISPTAFLVDRCENVYLSGWGGVTNSSSPNGGNTNGMPLTNDALQRNTDGSDFHTMVLDRDAQNLLFGTYFGENAANGDHVDGGTSRFDKEGVVYQAVCASCTGTNAFPTQPGNAFSRNNNSSNCNMAVFKIAFDLAGVEADFVPRDQQGQIIVNTQGCAPLTVNFDNNSRQAQTGGTPSYLWDFGDNGPRSTAFEPVYRYDSAGTYNVMLIITDSSSCNVADTAFSIIEVFPTPTVDAGPDQIVCVWDAFSLNAITQGAAYLWSPDTALLSDPTLRNPNGVASTSTEFELTLTDNRGCQARDTVLVEVDTSLQVFARSDSLLCRGGSVRLNAVSSNGISYSWNAIPNAFLSDPNIANPLVQNLDTTTLFVVTARNALGCEETDTVRMEVFEVFTLEDTFVCDGSSVVLQSSNGVSFNWTPLDGSLDNPTAASPTASPLVSTTYTVTATSAEGCISTKDVLVEVLDLPTVDAGVDQNLCIGDSLQLNGSGSGTYLWNPPLLLIDPTLPNARGYTEDSENFSLTVTDSIGCENTDIVSITVNPLPQIDAGMDSSICEGESVGLSASGGASYSWSPSGSLSDPGSANPIANPVSTTRYIVTATDANACVNSDSVLIEVVGIPQTSISSLNICTDSVARLTANGGDSYIWSTGETTSTIFVDPAIPQTYVARAIVGGCIGIPDSVTIEPGFDFPVASFEVDSFGVFAPSSVRFNNTSTGAESYEWFFGIGGRSTEENPTITFPSAGEYTARLIAISRQGCADTTFLTFTFDNVTLHVPSAFSPNGDDKNQNFRIGYIGIASLNIKIFSRWGSLVYESDDPDFQWDGVYKGKPLPEGVYVYVIRGRGENQQNYAREGTVTLFR